MTNAHDIFSLGHLANFFQPKPSINGCVVEYPPGKGNFSCALSNGQLNIKFCDIKAACVCNQPNKIEKRGLSTVPELHFPFSNYVLKLLPTLFNASVL